MANTADLPYVPLVPYNGTGATGGDALVDDLNIWYQVSHLPPPTTSPLGTQALTTPPPVFQSGDITFMLIATALVLLMVPGIGFFYSGLARRKSALSLLTLTLLSAAITSFQWFFWGYSLAFSRSASPYIGDLSNFGFTGLLAAPSLASPRIPDLLFAVYQGMFACVTVALAAGAVAERGRMLPCVVFMFVWATLVYDPIACWTWNPRGWSNKMGGLDFAGGTPVHVASGAAALAYSMVLGKRRGHGTQELNYRPHNVSHIVIGTVFMWVGWFGFNAGSALSANMRSVMAAVVTNLAAAVGGVTWCLLDYRLERKWSTVGFCSGVVAGLVAITPGSGASPFFLVFSFFSFFLLCDVVSSLTDPSPSTQATSRSGPPSPRPSSARLLPTTAPSSSSCSASTTRSTSSPCTASAAWSATSARPSSRPTTSRGWTA